MIAVTAFPFASISGYASFVSIRPISTSLADGGQDPVHARFNNCFLPYISAIPTASAICILLVHALQLLLPRRFRPGWSEAFIKEPTEQLEELEPKANRPLSRVTATLLVTSLVGFALQALATFYLSFRLQVVFLTVPWVCLNCKSQAAC